MNLMDFAFIAPFAFYVIIYAFAVKETKYTNKTVEKWCAFKRHFQYMLMSIWIVFRWM